MIHPCVPRALLVALVLLVLQAPAAAADPAAELYALVPPDYRWLLGLIQLTGWPGVAFYGIYTASRKWSAIADEPRRPFAIPIRAELEIVHHYPATRDGDEDVIPLAGERG